jgi:AraC-like DNA-binding protein
MAYLTRWRLQLGAQMLGATSYSVAHIPTEVAYESEAAFNRAFKREFSVPPARFRSQTRLAHATSSKYSYTLTDRGSGSRLGS